MGGLGFNDKTPVHEHVQALSADLDALVVNGDANLTSHVVATQTQFHLESTHVDLLQQPEAELVVHLEEGADHGSGERSLDQRAPKHVP